MPEIIPVNQRKSLIFNKSLNKQDNNLNTNNQPTTKPTATSQNKSNLFPNPTTKLNITTPSPNPESNQLNPLIRNNKNINIQTIITEQEKKNKELLLKQKNDYERLIKEIDEKEKLIDYFNADEYDLQIIQFLKQQLKDEKLNIQDKYDYAKLINDFLKVKLDTVEYMEQVWQNINKYSPTTTKQDFSSLNTEYEKFNKLETIYKNVGATQKELSTFKYNSNYYLTALRKIEDCQKNIENKTRYENIKRRNIEIPEKKQNSILDRIFNLFK